MLLLNVLEKGTGAHALVLMERAKELEMDV
jgi:hypothetical protein